MPRHYTPKPHATQPRRATFVVAADAGRARVFEAAHEDGQLTELADLLAPDLRLQDHDAVSDRKGRMHGAGTAGGQSFEPRQTREEHAAEAFARQVCGFLHQARATQELERIYLLAEPAFLGLLRQHLDPATRACVVQELATDLSRRPAADIRAALPRRL